MSTASAISASVDLLTAAVALMQQAQQISNMIRDAQAAGRELSDDEWAVIKARHAVARAALAQALAET